VGELIHQHEEGPHHLVTKKYVEKMWKDPLKRQWFQSYAYPFTDNVFALWSPKPEEWLQINHSCDPNAWLEGLNVVARKPIKKGQQITMDYATFCADNMAEFQCGCGESSCRKLVKPTDYLLPPIEAHYRGHVSDFVETKQREHKLKNAGVGASSHVANGNN